MSKKPNAFRVQDDAGVQEAYVNKLIGTLFDGAAVNIALGNIRTLPASVGEGTADMSKPIVVVTHRLVLSPTTAVELHNTLGNLLSTLQTMSSPVDKSQAN